MHRDAAEQHRQRAVLAGGLAGDGARERLGRAAALAREAGRQRVAADGGGELGEHAAHGAAAGLRGEPGVDLRVASDGEHRQPARSQPRVRAMGGDELLHTGDVALEYRVVAQQRRRYGRPADRLGQRRDALAAGRHRRHHRHAERIRQGLDIHRDPARLGLVGHVERHHHRHAEFGQQRGEVERAAQVLGVADLDQRAHVLIEQRAHGGALVVAARGQGEHARRVEQRGLAVEARGGARDLDRGARVIGHRDVGAGEAVEQHRLADVGVADEGQGAQHGSGGGGRRSGAVHELGCPKGGVSLER
ncbi:hypothetical protein MASR2M50_33690 [Thauera sp.]